MTKYSAELKLKAVLCVLDKGSSKGAVAKQIEQRIAAGSKGL